MGAPDDRMLKARRHPVDVAHIESERHAENQRTSL
jgi:hypothetical protein